MNDCGVALFKAKMAMIYLFTFLRLRRRARTEEGYEVVFETAEGPKGPMAVQCQEVKLVPSIECFLR